MEDVFQVSTFLKGGGKWMTAKELAEGGIEDIVKTFPAVSR
jgi:glycerol-3-phosphate dehydrogenase